MEPDDCGCLLDQHFAIFEDINRVRTLQDAKRTLKRKGRRRGRNEGGVNGFLTTLESFPENFRTRHGIQGDQLLKLDSTLHQDGLVEMAHAYLCVFGNGYRHWPEGYNDGTLEYPRDENE